MALYYYSPGAYAPGFMLSPASQAQSEGFKTQAAKNLVCRVFSLRKTIYEEIPPTLAALLLALFIISSVQSQVNSNLAGAIAKLPEHPAPPPPPKELAEALAALKSIQVDGDPPDPGDDAPIKVLMAYWEIQAGIETGKLPSEKVRQRLLQACEDEPIFPTTLFDFLPNTPDAQARLKQILDDDQIAGSDPLVFSLQEYRRELREWLMCNSEYLRDELIRDAGGARDDDGGVKSSRQLAALARMEWRTAEPLLKNYAGGAAPLTAAFAHGGSVCRGARLKLITASKPSA